MSFGQENILALFAELKRTPSVVVSVFFVVFVVFFFFPSSLSSSLRRRRYRFRRRVLTVRAHGTKNNLWFFFFFFFFRGRRERRRRRRNEVRRVKPAHVIHAQEQTTRRSVCVQVCVMRSCIFVHTIIVLNRFFLFICTKVDLQ